MKKEEKQGLIKFKIGMLTRIKTWIKRVFRRKDTKAKIEAVELIKKENEIIRKSREAHEKYVLMSEANIGQDVYELIGERLEVNKESIQKLIEIRQEKISYERIEEIYKEEKKEQDEYKKTLQMRKIDNKFIMSEYQVPKGVIGIITEDVEEKIRNVFKAITTRNGIIVFEEKTDKHSIDKLIEIIVKEAVKKYNIDENIIQIVEKSVVRSEDMKDMDEIIKADEKIETKAKTKKLYIYEEDKYFEEIVKEEEVKLKEKGLEVEIIRGKSLEQAINQINKTKNYGASIYSQDRKKGYKFINLVKSENVFFNGSLQNVEKVEKINNEYYTIKNIICENILN